MTKPSSGKKPDGMLSVEQGTISPIYLLMGNVEGSGKYYGSDTKRSPMHKARNPGEPEYDGSYPWTIMIITCLYCRNLIKECEKMLQYIV